MLDFETVDFYTETDRDFQADPHAYFDYLRGKGPITRLPHHNAMAVTGYDEAIQIMLDTEHFSSFTTITGAMTEIPFELTGDDVSEQIAAARTKSAFGDIVLTTDGERHAALRSILTVLFTPRRAKALEDSLRGTADALIDEFIADGRVDLGEQYGGPYGALVIADLLGIPAKGRQRIRAVVAKGAAGAFGATREENSQATFVAMGKEIFGLLAWRKVTFSPPAMAFKRLLGLGRQDDILGELVMARYPDGTKPRLADLAGLATMLFGAGQDTTNRLISNAMLYLAQKPDLQQQLRSDPPQIPAFVEEMLRYDGSVKSAGRICIRTTTVAGVEIKAGTHIMLSHMAANRDPRRFENPSEVVVGRPKAKEHLGFGRGPHTCIGAQLARAEARVSLERLLARLGNIRLSEEHHGPEHARRLNYDPSSILRALSHLHLEFTAAS
jgi:cytochrome P450